MFTNFPTRFTNFMDDVHQLYRQCSPTYSRSSPRFHQRTTEDQKLIVEFHSIFPVVRVCTAVPLLFSLFFVSFAFRISTFLSPFTSFATVIKLITVSKMYRLLERICFISFWQRLWKAICLPAFLLFNAPFGPVPQPLRLGLWCLKQIFRLQRSPHLSNVCVPSSLRIRIFCSFNVTLLFL